MSDAVREDFLTQLRAEVAAAARRVDEQPRPAVIRGAPSKRPRRILSAAAMVVVIALLGALYVATSRPQPSAVQVDREGGSWVFRWDEPGPDVDELERAAREVGLDVEVTEQPTGSYSAGRVHGFSLQEGGGVPNLILERTEDRESGWGFRLPVGYAQPVGLVIGRLAERGEQWQMGQPATAPGAALACRPLVGQPLGRTLEVLEGTDLRIDGFSDLTDASAPLRRDVDPQDLYEFAGTEVISLEQTGPDELWISVASETISDDFRPPPVIGC